METKEFKSFYKTVGGNEGNKCNYTTRLDTYGCGCFRDCPYCIDGETLVFMYDGTSRKMKDVEIGDEIYGIEKDVSASKLVKSVVLNKWETSKPSYKITLANGVELICSGDHRWLSNRGWKYTIGEMTGDNRRPYLTTNNYLLGFTDYLFDEFEETDDYKTGYLSGMINGDGHIGEYHYENPNGGGNQYQFRLTLKEEEGVIRTADYLNYFDIDVVFFDFPMKDRNTKEEIPCKSIRTHKRANYEKILKLIEIPENPSKEFLRGFLAGFYDAEGTKNMYTKRVFNINDKLIGTYIAGLNAFSFNYTFDNEKTTSVGNIVKTVRILGDMSEILRFYQTVKPAIKNKFSFDGMHIKTDGKTKLKIASIEPYKDKQTLYDITTSTQNFIANGVVSHNCYSKSLLDFRNLWHPENPSVADIEKIKRKIAKLPKDIPPLRLGGMTDCFMEQQEKRHHVTYETLKALNEYRIPYLIVTKSDMVASDEYVEVLDKQLAHIQISVTTTDDDFAKTYEHAPVPSKRIKAIERLQELGFDIQLRLSPFIPQYIDFDVLNNVECDKILIEFLRVNSWIMKWLDIDFSEYTIKQSGYRHLPLEKKKEYISKITGFKETSVCEDENEAYEYWKHSFNHNPDDCCNLRL